MKRNGYYFRHVSPDILIELEDLNNLKLEEYDKMCGEKRNYHPSRQVAISERCMNKKKKP
ncbi:hypothetical protein IR083_07060 [Dysgonomonas sp. GY75]|uniref:hypothetical protein n=1 Tax=Dysgonomonas sp. GY75 TaxID=2780419 RepID=UPI001884191F|nr:hypothetical protein [Dysgonomonas sp. GY75]MBF0648573.1 hypothetical protein [Dysgonomonas sp. GY75]